VASAGIPADREAVARHLAAAAVRILEHTAPDLVAVTGGDRVRADPSTPPRRFDLAGAPADRLALGRLVRDDSRSLPLLTKAGGFGAADLLATILGGAS
jgi:uncharacterized protein YgbK (DUF1537 family)